MAAVTNNTFASEYPSSMADDPLFLHHREILGGVLMSQPLVDENYLAWTRSIRKALISKNKLGFIDGTLTLSSHLRKTPFEIQAWIWANNMVGTWIINAVSPRIQASIIYVDTNLEIWNDLREIFSQGSISTITKSHPCCLVFLASYCLKFLLSLMTSCL